MEEKQQKERKKETTTTDKNLNSFFSCLLGLFLLVFHLRLQSLAQVGKCAVRAWQAV